MHTCMHAYTQTYIATCIHIDAYMYANMHTYLHIDRQTDIHSEVV